jgi:hypothetical protein
MVRGSLFGLLAIAEVMMASGDVAMALSTMARTPSAVSTDMAIRICSEIIMCRRPAGALGLRLTSALARFRAMFGIIVFTYQPLMPHEFLYPHHRTYHRTYDEGRGLTRTGVHWYSPPGKNAAHHIHHIFRLARLTFRDVDESEASLGRVVRGAARWLWPATTPRRSLAVGRTSTTRSCPARCRGTASTTMWRRGTRAAGGAADRSEQHRVELGCSSEHRHADLPSVPSRLSG